MCAEEVNIMCAGKVKSVDVVELSSCVSAFNALGGHLLPDTFWNISCLNSIIRMAWKNSNAFHNYQRQGWVVIYCLPSVT